MFFLFFFVVIGGSLFQLFGTLTYVRSNSMFYSAKAPERERYPDLELPHITIQMPVYREGLAGVTIPPRKPPGPTVTSIQAAIEKYEEQGGTASIFVNNGGMQTVAPELAEARKVFYEVNDIEWCPWPKDASMITIGDGDRAMNTIIEPDEERTLAAGNVRIGDLILLIDSDTRVPEDCLLYGALELHESPEVAIFQNASGVMLSI
ncbi:hypothetical protein BDZ45DRAFT_802898 [Acephala macrosclerotiorum]|nr:hypothetical protein BDZ45DRAFT_802898 [Acephala macrosclerotiorum]